MTRQLGGLDRDRPRPRRPRRARSSPRALPRATRSSLDSLDSPPRVLLVAPRSTSGDRRRPKTSGEVSISVHRRRARPSRTRDRVVSRARGTRSIVDRRAGTPRCVSTRSSCGVSRAGGEGRGRPRARGAFGDARARAGRRGDGGRRRARRRGMGRRRRRGRRERRERAVIPGKGAVGEGTGRSRGMEMVV